MNISNRLTVLTIGAVLASCAISYCSGKSAGARDAKLVQNAQRISVATSHRAQAEKITLQALGRSDRAGVERSAVKARVVVTSDSTVSVDRLPPINLPLPVVSVLRSDDKKIKLDSLTIVALTVEIVTLKEERDAWKERAQLLQPSRCGRKCGVAIGVALTVGAAIAVEKVRRMISPIRASMRR